MAVIRVLSEDLGAALVTTVAVLLLAFLVGRAAGYGSRRRRLPPGPRGWPIVGHLPSFGTLPHRSLSKLSKKYGPLMHLKLGSVPAIVVSSPKVAEKILKTHDVITSSRPGHIVGDCLSYGKMDIAMAPYGEHWRHLRRICLNGLLTPLRIDQFKEIRRREILEGLHFILEESQQGNAVNMSDILKILNVNNMTQMMMNKRFCVRTSSSKSAAAASELTGFHEDFKEIFMLMGAFNLADYFPLVKSFDLQGLNKRLKVVEQKFSIFLDTIIEEHRQKLYAASTENRPEDFVDSLLKLRERDEVQDSLSTDAIKAVLGDMLAGASDTTASVTEWTLAELLRHPQIMSRVQDELDSVVGRDRLVREDDLPSLKYLQVVVKEGLRLHPVGPLLIPHESTEDLEIEGFHIPARTRIFVNQWASHTDPELWERPLEFDPDRFLDTKKDFKGHDFDYLPFGAGRRMCPGMNLGVLGLTFTLATHLHAVNFTLAGGEKAEDLDMSEVFGLVLYKRVPLKIYGKPRLPVHVIYPAITNEA